MYLLDTCVLSELIKPVANGNVIRWIQAQDEDCLFLSVLTLGEVQKGISKLPKSSKRVTLEAWLEEDLRGRFEGRILEVTDAVALAWGQLLGEGERKGRLIPVIDGLIAATAAVHHLTIVSRNLIHLQPSGATVINPWE